MQCCINSLERSCFVLRLSRVLIGTVLTHARGGSILQENQDRGGGGASAISIPRGRGRGAGGLTRK